MIVGLNPSTFIVREKTKIKALHIERIGVGVAKVGWGYERMSSLHTIAYLYDIISCKTHVTKIKIYTFGVSCSLRAIKEENKPSDHLGDETIHTFISRWLFTHLKDGFIAEPLLAPEVKVVVWEECTPQTTK